MTTKQAEPLVIDAQGLHYSLLNQRVREAMTNGSRRIRLKNVHGQRYIGTNLYGCSDLDSAEIEIFGTPGNDLGAFLNGPRLTVYGNAQDGTGNTMNEGEIIVHGHAGDITGFSARGGKIFIKEDVGYRSAIHMKEYKDKKPLLVIGGTAQDFLGEYMAGGNVILLGLNLKEGQVHKSRFIGTGMHGGIIFLRGKVHQEQLGKEVGIQEPTEQEWRLLKDAVNQFAQHFDSDPEAILKAPFIKLIPLTLRPYGRIYAY